MAVSWRYPLSEHELDACLDMSPERLGAELVGPEAARAVWHRIYRNPAVICAVLESYPPFMGHRLVGFGASALVRRSFLDAELENPRPFLNSRIIASVNRGESFLLTRDEIGAANAGDGLDVVLMHGTAIDAALSDMEVQTLSGVSLVESHAGYHVRRIAMETSRPWQHEVSRQTSIYDVHASFASSGRVLHVTGRQKAATLKGSLANVIFLYRAPTLRLSESDQELLATALSGGTDEELAVRLGLSVSAVKARWRATFDRVAEVAPSLFDDGPLGGTPETTGRGAQKRHRVLAYVREHPEELRPFDWTTSIRPLAARR